MAGNFLPIFLFHSLHVRQHLQLLLNSNSQAEGTFDIGLVPAWNEGSGFSGRKHGAHSILFFTSLVDKLVDINPLQACPDGTPAKYCSFGYSKGC